MSAIAEAEERGKPLTVEEVDKLYDKIYNEAVEKHGTKKPGEKPAREVKAPKSYRRQNYCACETV